MSIQSNFPAIKPTLLLDFANTEQLDSRVTFTRASTATYYGTQTAKAEENLQTYSQEFNDAVWGKSFSSVTANSTTAPDGTSTADSLIEDSSTNVHRVAGSSNIVSSSTYTISVFAKPLGSGSTRYLTISLNSTTGVASVTFDVSAGVVTQTLATTQTVNSSSITAVGNGWYRCVATITPTVSAGFLLSLASSTTFANGGRGSESYAGDGASGLFIWGAQQEQRSAVTAYTATTTQPITNYIPVLLTAASGVARFDHNPTTGESLGLLIEESRTNLLTYSEQFDNGAWTKTNATITANTVVAPDGTLTGDKLVENTTSSTQHYTTQQRSGLTAGSTYTFSVYAKAGGRSRFYLMEGNNTTGQAWFDVSTGTIVSTTGNGSPTSTITAVGNGWYKCTLTLTLIGTIHNCQIRLTNSTTDTYTGDGFSGMFLWGAQLEAGSFATSYIPTVASQVTRSADTPSMTGTNFSTWFNQADGTLYAEGLSLGSPNRNLLTVSDGTNNNVIEMYRVNSSSSASMYVARDGAGQVNLNITGSFPAGSFIKMSIGYQGNNSNAAANGTLGTLDTVCSIPAVNQLRIGTSGSGGSAHLAGTIKKIAYYPVRVTDAQLQALTS